MRQAEEGLVARAYASLGYQQGAPVEVTTLVLERTEPHDGATPQLLRRPDHDGDRAGARDVRGLLTDFRLLEP